MREHPVFARVYAVMAALNERGPVARWRREVLADVRGRLLIVGLGPGYDLLALPPAVEEVVAVEPEPTMRAMARRRAERSGVPLRMLAATAEALPLPDDSVDAVLCAYVLCSVGDPARALAEIRRVLRPGGTLHVLEHVRAQVRWLAAAQDRLEGPWGRVTGGCHPNRSTRAALEAAGFDTSRLVDHLRRVDIPLVAPQLIGTATVSTAER